MTATIIQNYHGVPTLFLDDRRIAPITAYVGPRFLTTFQEAGIQLYTLIPQASGGLVRDNMTFQSSMLSLRIT